MRQLWAVVDFIRGVRRRLRYGKLSRAPIRLIRLLWEGNSIQCDWLARSTDLWDSDLSPWARDSKASVQALEDAMAVRNLLLDTFAEVKNAELRVFRQAGSGHRELIITGKVSRDTLLKSDIASPVMRAKLSGFEFWLDEGVLGTLKEEETVAVSNS